MGSEPQKSGTDSDSAYHDYVKITNRTLIQSQHFKILSKSKNNHLKYYFRKNLVNRCSHEAPKEELAEKTAADRLWTPLRWKKKVSHRIGEISFAEA